MEPKNCRKITRRVESVPMRLDDAPGTASRSYDARVNANAGVAPGLRDRRPPEPRRAPEREPKPGGAIAMALERAKLKK